MARVEIRVQRSMWLVYCRLLLICCAIVCLIAIGWRWCLCCCAGLACSYWWRATRVTSSSSSSSEEAAGSHRQLGQRLSHLSQDELAELALELTGSCEEFGEVAEAFEAVKRSTKCPFARSARLWCGEAWNSSLGVAENAAANAWRLRAFCAACRRLQLDGFLLQVASPHCDTFQVFSASVMSILRTLAACNSVNCMADVDNLDRLRWVFEFAGLTFFVTTFAPFYSESDSRFAYGASCGFVLLQPEISFARNQLPPDTPDTKWNAGDAGRTVRDVTRSAFAAAGQSYLVRRTVAYPMIRDIVQVPKKLLPLPTEDTPDHLRWWILGQQTQTNSS